MKIFKNFSLDGIDTFCSTLGKELIFEDKNDSKILLPAYNVGFYENEINPDSTTKAIEKCYFLFNSVLEFNAKLFLYIGLSPDSNGLIELSGDKINYYFKFEALYNKRNDFMIEGTCLRHNSFSYGTYTFLADSLSVILVDNYLVEYKNNNSYKSTKSIQDFLLNKDLEDVFFETLIKAV